MGLNFSDTQASLKEEIERLGRVRSRLTETVEKIDRRIQALTAATEALAAGGFDVSLAPEKEDPLPKVPEEPKFEITASVREILKSGELYRAPELRDELIKRGWQATELKNPLAVVHQILKRLHGAGEVGIHRYDDNSKIYYDARLKAERESEQEQRRAAERKEWEALSAVRSEVFQMLGPLCIEVLRKYPRGISSRQIYRELKKDGVDLSCYYRPASAVALALKEQPNVVVFRAERNGVVNNFFKIAEEAPAEKPAKN